MKGFVENTKLSLASCRKILGTDSLLYTDQEIIIMRDWMYHLADITIDSLETGNEQPNTKTHEKQSDIIYPRID
jgi:hypothetical protein